jgi:hypothetical protein
MWQRQNRRKPKLDADLDFNLAEFTSTQPARVSACVQPTDDDEDR